MIKKLIIFVLIFFLSIFQTNAWLWLIAEPWDILNISKWNEMIDKLNLKLEQSNITWTWNISVENSWTWVLISFTWSVPSAPIPDIKTQEAFFIFTSQTWTLLIEWDDFIPNSTVSIPWFDWTIDSYEVLSQSKIKIDITAWDNIWTYDIVVSNNWVQNTLWPWNGAELLKVINSIKIEWNDTDGRKYEDGTYARTCNDYKNPEGLYSYDWDIWDGIYWIKPDENQNEFKVYCDMTRDNWGWTRFVNIKGNYSFDNARDCWLWTNISNDYLECFNPNRYWIEVNNFMNIDWSWEYTVSSRDSNPSVDTETTNSSRHCLGHSDYMTVMRSNQTPASDGSDAQYIRLWRSYCDFNREPGWVYSKYMNYDK